MTEDEKEVARKKAARVLPLLIDVGHLKLAVSKASLGFMDGSLTPAQVYDMLYEAKAAFDAEWGHSTYWVDEMLAHMTGMTMDDEFDRTRFQMRQATRRRLAGAHTKQEIDLLVRQGRYRPKEKPNGQ